MKFEDWQKLMRVFGLEENKNTYTSLIVAYSEKHRSYHTLEHIEACVKHLKNTRQLANKPHEIELALWFHDAIYKPYSSTNKLDSAIWAKQFLYENNTDQATCERIYNLIMVTLHNGKTNTSDEELMIDIDLSILGSSPMVYQAFEKNVRKEYRWVPYFLYCKKRKQILQGFLKQKQIYQTEFFNQLFEKQARKNLQVALLAL